MHPLRVLIVEDNPSDATILRAILESTGIPMKAKLTSSVDEAEDSLAERPYSLVLSDVNLEGIKNGFDLWGHCQSEHPAVAFVITSGIDDHEWDKLSMPGDIAPLRFNKPYCANEIRQTISTLLKK